MSKTKKGYDVFKGLLSGNQVNTLSHDHILDCVQEKTRQDLGACSDVYVLHDPCDIRKPNSLEMEHLGKVLSLDKQTINGYYTLNSVAVDPTQQGVHLLTHTVYSNQMPNFVSQKTLNELEKASASTKKLVAEGKHINTSIMYQRQIKESSEILKKENPSVKICHISDREFDNETHFKSICSVGDHFVTRLKLSRLSNETRVCYTPKGKVSKKVAYKKLVDKKFEHKGEYTIEKLTIKGTTHHKVRCIVEWEDFRLEEQNYTVVRIALRCGAKMLFDHPMLLITNRNVSTLSEAREVYSAYILRFKIEVVFRFLKQDLGWESFQVRDFNTIRNLLSIAFFLVGYFKELEEKLKEHPLAHLLCELALSKGKVTIFFLFKGIKKLINFQQVSLWMKENNISAEQVDELIDYLKLNES